MTVRSWARSLRGAGEEGLKVHNFRAEGRREPRVDDEAAWARPANPGLGVIIDAATFRAQARRVIATPADAPFFHRAPFEIES